MRNANTLVWSGGSLARWLVGFKMLAAFSAPAAEFNVNIVDFAFSPTAVTIQADDSVIWSWVGNFAHSSTSNDTNLWNSGIFSHGAAYTNTFKAVGNFPYHCLVHPLSMLASVTVQGQARTNSPPAVSITSPVDSAVFAAPWTGTIRATASDSDGTVAKIDFFANATLLGTRTNPPTSTSFTVTNLPAGSYTLAVMATDDGGASTTSAQVNISVVNQTPITLSSIQRLSAASFQFSYSATSGLKYVVQRSSNLSSWNPLVTNTASSNSVTFTDTVATQGANLYRVNLLPNP